MERQVEENDKQQKEEGKRCYTSTETCIHSRRCFVTGEYCSKQTNIQRERKKLYDAEKITAFVIMNFSDMSNVVYKWRMQSFIESLTKYLYVDKTSGRLYCSAEEKIEMDKDPIRIKEIRVVRSDSDPASNYVICSRICQQMQIADLIIVDVSNQNANVFYEFGMAVALGKLILPICYSESFYKMDKELAKNHKVEHHIGCYPWRKELFEYYGIRYKRKKSPNSNADTTTHYIEFNEAKKEEYKFEDMRYDRFPYHEKLNGKSKKVGEIIYEKLRTEYNGADYEDNTLIVYTMDGFLNEEQAGRCIVNFYRNITARMRQEQCFCGERVGVLVQDKGIPDSEKDAESVSDLFYSVGEIIHIGTNRATYEAARQRIRANDVLKEVPSLKQTEDKGEQTEDKGEQAEDEGEQTEDKGEQTKNIGERKDEPTERQLGGIKHYIEKYIGNRGMMIYPIYPVYVARMKNGLQKDLLDEFPEDSNDTCRNGYMFCLYHIMLKTLRYTNEIVVDITDNCLQSLFWLGAAHGSDIYAITVLHEKTETEKNITSGKEEKKVRNVFDVAGLWAAVFHSYDTDGFYKQLELAQQGIEYHSRLMLNDRNYYEKRIRDEMFSYDDKPYEERVANVIKEKEHEERLVLESYYRKLFWNVMLRYNRLRIYLLQRHDKDERDKQPRVHTAKWDFDAISALSHYLSKRTVIGEYLVKALQEGEVDAEASQTNFICMGSVVKPLKQDLPTYISRKIGEGKQAKGEYGADYNIVHKYKTDEREGTNCSEKIQYKGFIEGLGDDREILYTQHPQYKCAECSMRQGKENRVFRDIGQLNGECFLNENGTHIEIAQLILWRENPDAHNERSYFRVQMSGSSGPATYALASLLVDENQKQDFFRGNDGKGDKRGGEEPSYLLSKLQEAARQKFMEIFLQKLQEKFEGPGQIRLEANGTNTIIEGEQKKRYISLVKHAVSYYLSTVLYRYFLPFLSESDIERIYNGMCMYIRSMKAEKVSPFALDYPRKGDLDYDTVVSDESIEIIVKLIPQVLLSVLKAFRGLEAFYEIEVRQQKNDKEDTGGKDTRATCKIRMLERENKTTEVNYFFCFEGQDKG